MPFGRRGAGEREFQSQDEPRMALRILTYTGLLYGELVRSGEVAAGEPLPPVLPMVLYNGARPWQAAREMRDLVASVGPELRVISRPSPITWLTSGASRRTIPPTAA